MVAGPIAPVTRPRGARRVRLACVVFVCVAAAGCGRGRRAAGPGGGAEAPAAPGPALVFKPTAAITASDNLGALVDALAKQGQIESSHVGAAGTPSAAWQAYQALRPQASPRQMVALLMHESPIVRGYAAWHVVTTLPEERMALVPLLADATPVKLLQGCVGSTSTVRDFVLELLCQDGALAAFADLLLKAAADPALGLGRLKAMTCVAAERPAAADELAGALLLGRPDEETRAAALEVVVRTHGASGCTAAADSVGHASPRVRIAAARALGNCPGAGALSLVDRLRRDPVEAVRLAAAGAYLRHPERDPAVVTSLIADETQRRPLALTLAQQPTPDSLAQLQAYVIAHPDDFEPLELLRAGRRGAEVTALMRALLAKSPVGQLPVKSTVRAEALAYLSNPLDPADLPELRRSLASSNRREWTVAVTGVVIGKDAAAIPILTTIVGEQDDPLVRLEAAQALLGLRARGAAGAVERAATTGNQQVDEGLRRVAGELRGLK